MFFTTVYISSSFVLGAVFGVVSVSTLSISYLPPALALSMSPLLVFKILLDLDPIVVEPGFVPEAVYYYSLAG